MAELEIDQSNLPRVQEGKSKHSPSHTHLDMVGKTTVNLPIPFCNISNFFPDTKLQLPLVALFICTWLSVASALILNKSCLFPLFNFILQPLVRPQPCDSVQRCWTYRWHIWYTEIRERNSKFVCNT